MTHFDPMDPTTGIAEDDKRILEDRLVDTIERNLDELFKTPKPASSAGALEVQQAYINHSLERCWRCGDHVAYLTPVGMNTLCDPCTIWAKSHEQPGLKWFREMVNTIADHQRDKQDG